MAYVSVSPEDWMLAMTLANSNGFPMESLIVPLTLMLWAESEKERINNRKVKVLFIGWFFTAFDSNFNNSQSLILLVFSRRGRNVFRRERREIIISLRALRLLRALCVKLIFDFFKTLRHHVDHLCSGSFRAILLFFL